MTRLSIRNSLGPAQRAQRIWIIGSVLQFAIAGLIVGLALLHGGVA